MNRLSGSVLVELLEEFDLNQLRAFVTVGRQRWAKPELSTMESSTR